jgi:hypothetical protein
MSGRIDVEADELKDAQRSHERAARIQKYKTCLPVGGHSDRLVNFASQALFAKGSIVANRDRHPSCAGSSAGRPADTA